MYLSENFCGGLAWQDGLLVYVVTLLAFLTLFLLIMAVDTYKRRKEEGITLKCITCDVRESGFPDDAYGFQCDDCLDSRFDETADKFL